MTTRLVLLLAALLASACSEAASGDRSTVRPGKIQPDRGPYVSVAVDNHFHDIHPADHIAVDEDRAFVVRNEGRNLHNVTIARTEISEDVRPGKSFRLAPVGSRLAPGTYEIVCRYHVNLGMTGQIRVAGN